MVDGLHGEVEGHELDDWAEAFVGSASGEASEAHLGDRRVYHSLLAILLVETFGDLVGSLVLSNFLAWGREDRGGSHAGLSPMRKTFSSRVISSSRAMLMASRIGTSMVAIDLLTRAAPQA
jgi:hypothetical protein